jgi:hypothetical protein
MSQCTHVYRSGKMKGQQCKTIPRNGDRCYKHARGKKEEPVQQNISSTPTEVAPTSASPVSPKPKYEMSPNDEVFIPHISEKPKITSKLRFSTFLITINPNLGLYENVSVEDKQKFKAYIQTILDKDNVADWIIDRGQDDARPNLKKIETKYRFEVGPQHGALHSHAIVRLEHTGYMKMKLSEMRGLARKIFGHDAKIICDAQTDGARAWEQYIQKSSNEVDI